MRHRHLFISTLLAAGAFALPALAQSVAPAREDAAKVEDVVVTASGFEQRIEQAPASISLISGETIRSQRAGSIAEILSDVPGVDIGAPVGKTGGRKLVEVSPNPFGVTLPAVFWRRPSIRIRV